MNYKATIRNNSTYNPAYSYNTSNTSNAWNEAPDAFFVNKEDDNMECQFWSDDNDVDDIDECQFYNV